jgi:hypothetical protein
MGHVVPPDLRMGQWLAAACWWHAGSSPEDGRCDAQQSRGTSADTDAAWKRSQAVTHERKCGRSVRMEAPE